MTLAVPASSATLKSAGKTNSGASSLSSISTPKIPLGADSELAMLVFTGLPATTVKTSLTSSRVSSRPVTVTVVEVSPGAKVTV